MPLLTALHKLFPAIKRVIFDGAYQGPKLGDAFKAIADWQQEIVKRSDADGFKVLPKRWIVERTIAWLGRCRRLAKDFENRARIALAFIQVAMIRLLLRRLTRHAT